MKVDVSRVVSCPQDVAFEYYSDRDKDLEWWYGTLETKTTSKVVRGVGEINHQKQRFPGIPFIFEIDVEVVEWLPPSRWREVCRNGLSHYDVWYTVDAIDDRHCRVGLHGEVALRAWMKAIYPVSRWVLRRLTEANFDRLKTKLDGLGAMAH